MCKQTLFPSLTSVAIASQRTGPGPLPKQKAAALWGVTADCQIIAACVNSAALLIVQNYLGRRAAHLDLRAHPLQACGKRFNLRLLVRISRLLFCNNRL